VPPREPGATGGGVVAVSEGGPRRVVVGGVPIDFVGVVLVRVLVVNGEDRLTSVPGRASPGRLSAAAPTRGQVAGWRRGGGVRTAAATAAASGDCGRRRCRRGCRRGCCRRRRRSPVSVVASRTPSGVGEHSISNSQRPRNSDLGKGGAPPKDRTQAPPQDTVHRYPERAGEGRSRNPRTTAPRRGPRWHKLHHRAATQILSVQEYEAPRRLPSTESARKVCERRRTCLPSGEGARESGGSLSAARGTRRGPPRPLLSLRHAAPVSVVSPPPEARHCRAFGTTRSGHSLAAIEQTDYKLHGEGKQ